MAMNPETNQFEVLTPTTEEQKKEMEQQLGTFSALVRPDGSPVPKHWSVFTEGERVVIKGYTFMVAYIGESNILFEPVGPVILGEGKEKCPK